MRVILLLLNSRVLSLASFGKPSRMMMALSDRSMLSNWFWTAQIIQLLPFQQPALCINAAAACLTSVVPRFSIWPILCPAAVCQTEPGPNMWLCLP